MKLIIGSKALEVFGCNRKKPVDIDYWYTEDEANPGGDSVVIPQNIMNLVPQAGGYALPSAIYTIKLSHSIYDIHWQMSG